MLGTPTTTSQDNKDDDTISIQNTVRIGASVLPTKYSKPAENLDKCKCKCPLPIFLPFGQAMFMWNVFLCIILFYSIVEIPYVGAFEIIEAPISFVAFLGAFIDICLLVDIVINFRTAYIDKYDRLRIIHDPKLIAKRYFKTWFIIDFLSALPFTYIIILFSEDQADGSTIFVFFSLLRIVKILKMFHIVRQHFHFIPNRTTKMILTLLKTLCLMLIIAHYFACFWYTIGLWAHRKNMNSWIDIIIDNGDENASIFAKYSYAFYWAIVTLFTTGYGDISAYNIYEQWTCSLGILIGSCLFAYYISVLTSGLVDDLKHESKTERIEECMAFCARYNLPKEIARAVITHMRYYNSYNYLFDHETTMNALPNYLQNQISEHLATTQLKELDIFESLPANIIGQIALKLKSVSVGENQFVYKAGDMGKVLYIQRTGKSRLIPNGVIKYGDTWRHLQRGDVVGENCILSRRRQHSVICLMWSEFYVLDIYDIVDVLKDNFGLNDAQKEWNKIKTVIKNTQCDSKNIKYDSKIINKDLLDVTNINSKHRHVRFETIDREDFQTFVAPGLCDDGAAIANQSLSKIKRMSTFSEEELALEEQDTQARELDRNKKKKNRISFQTWTDLFSSMQKQTSHSRNEKVHSHYLRKPSHATVSYSHLPRFDIDLYDKNGLDGLDEDYLFLTPTKSKTINGSAGFFNFSIANNNLSGDDDERNTHSDNKNDNGKYKHIVNNTEMIEFENITHSISMENTDRKLDIKPIPLKGNENRNSINSIDGNVGEIGS